MVTRFFSKMKDAVKGTKSNLASKIEDLFTGKKEIDEKLLEDLEAILIGADIGVRTTVEMLDKIREKAGKNEVSDREALLSSIRESLIEILNSAPTPKTKTMGRKPEVIFVVGVNGVGKTTTIGKLANRFSKDGKKVIICASDTFRAAAIEQLEIWAGRSNTTLIRKDRGADPAAVLYDSLDKALQEKADIVIVDTAGRLHTKANLMRELEKMNRIASKKIEGAPHQVLLVIDATTGQNGLEQARQFTRSAGVTGIVITKLDGTARGGIVVAIVKELKLPVLYVGIGEKLEDLIDFNSEDFVESILSPQ